MKSIKKTSRIYARLPPKVPSNVKLNSNHTKDYINEFDRLNGLCSGVLYTLGDEVFVTTNMRERKYYHEID